VEKSGAAEMRFFDIFSLHFFMLILNLINHKGFVVKTMTAPAEQECHPCHDLLCDPSLQRPCENALPSFFRDLSTDARVISATSAGARQLMF
jgi:hypothetical protein